MTRGMWARLKAQLAQDDDAVVAALLGMSLDELREQLGRGIFPDDRVIALAAARPDLGLDYRAIMTGEPAEKNAPDDGAKGGKNTVWGPVEIDDINQLKLQTDSGVLEIVAPIPFGEGSAILFRLSPDVTTGLYVLLGRMQQALESDIEGAPASDARH